MINRSQDDSGAWTYADEDEHNFVVWVEVGCSTSREHSFASGLPVPWRHSLLSMDGFINGDSRPLTTSERDQLMFLRNKAFEAYKAGDYSLQDSKLGELQSECRRLGQLPLALIGEKVSKGHERRDDAGDKADFIRLARAVVAPPSTVPAWLAIKELAPYASKYPGRDTLRRWINEAVPGALKTGRPRKDTVIR